MHRTLVGGEGVPSGSLALATSLGADIKIFVSEHLSLRPEFRIYAGDSRGVVEPPLGVFRYSTVLLTAGQ